VRPVEGADLAVPRRPFPWARTIVAGATALAAVSGILFTRVHFQYDLTDLRTITPEREEYARVADGVFPVVASPAVVLASSAEEVDEVVAAVEAIIRADTLSPTVESVRSVRSLSPPTSRCGWRRSARCVPSWTGSPRARSSPGATRRG
jgi:hypothetical protein